MGYMHIDNLYKNQTILMFRTCYALEKIHGTSAHVKREGAKLTFFSGGESYDNFKALFNEDALNKSLSEKFGDESCVTIFGEAYGGKQQGMRATYGDKLKFVVFDVKIGERWMEVPVAEAIANEHGFEFVDYALISTDLEAIDAERDKPSTQAIRNGIVEPKNREGVVLRPVKEFALYGNRIISKHKRAEFVERKTQPPVDAEKQKALDDAAAVADEWVVEMRMTHVLDKIGNPTDMNATGRVIAAMIEDVMREGEGEIADTKDVRRAIGAAAAKMFKARVATLE